MELQERQHRASAYDLASVTDTPVILIVNSKGMSVSLAAYIKGFAEYRKDSHIKGVILESDVSDALSENERASGKRDRAFGSGLCAKS